jgi:hypothetical protein
LNTLTRASIKAGQAGSDTAFQRDPVVVLSYPHSGAAKLQRALSDYTGLAFTSATGVLPLCQLAVSTWRRAENRDGRLSPLAIASIRATIGTLITAIIADIGGRRWCETAFTDPRSAESFLDIYPSTKIICVHRNCLDVIAEAVAANPWGFINSPIESFSLSYPGNQVAAAAAYWSASTQALLEFEAAHAESCYRVSHEDLINPSARSIEAIASFLSLAAAPQAEPDAPQQDPTLVMTWKDDQLRKNIPIEMIPEPLLNLVNRLMTRIGYAELGESP